MSVAEVGQLELPQLTGKTKSAATRMMTTSVILMT